MPLFFRISGALLLAVFLGLSIHLQVVDVNESCSAEALASGRGAVLWYSVAAAAVFVAGVLLPRRGSLFLVAAGILLILPSLTLFSCICCHESYGNYPVYWVGGLILWWVMSFIHIGTSHSSEQP